MKAGGLFFPPLETERVGRRKEEELANFALVAGKKYNPLLGKS